MLSTKDVAYYIALPHQLWRETTRLSTVYQKKLLDNPKFMPEKTSPLLDNFKLHALRLAKFVLAHPDAWMKLEGVIRDHRKRNRMEARRLFELANPGAAELRKDRRRGYMLERRLKQQAAQTGDPD